MIAAEMRPLNHFCGFLILGFCVAVAVGCRTHDDSQIVDHQRLTGDVLLRDVTFRSAALGRDMQYRVISPRQALGAKLPVIYLLHGGGGGFRDWSNYSDIAKFAEFGALLVMPEGESSYYTNAVDPPENRFEDYIIHDLIADVEAEFPVATGRANRAIVGLSMGGFGAVKIGLRHQDLFAFAAGLSSALDVARRPFSIKRLHQSLHYTAIFGPAGSRTRRENDPFVLVRTVNAESAPYLFLTCGEQEGLLPVNREFAALLGERHFKYEFHTVQGSHDWNQWNSCLPTLLQALSARMNFKP